MTKMRSGDERGYPLPGGGVPTAQDVYDATEAIPYYKTLSTRAHPELQFLRAAPVMKAIEELRDRCLYPVNVRAADMPTGVGWNNFAVVLYNFHAIYCHLEGLSRTSTMSKDVMR